MALVRFTQGTSSWGWGSRCRNRATTAMFFSLILLRIRGLFYCCGFCDSRVTAAGPFCLRLRGRDGCQSVGFRSLEEIHRSANNSLFSLFPSVSVHCAHVLDSCITPAPSRRYLWTVRFWVSRSRCTFTDAFTTRHFASFLWVFLRFLVSSEAR